MSSLTPRVSLYKPVGGENVNVTTDLDNNYDKIDTNLNFRVAASATARNAISPFWEGLNVRQTDTGTCWVSNGSAPISASWDQITTSNTYASANNISAAASGTIVFNLRVGAEANNRFQVRGDGQHFWGAGGASAVDVNLYRKDSTTLKTDDNFEATGTIQTTGDLITTAGQLQLQSGGVTKFNTIPSTSTTVANTVTETIMASYTIPANDMIAGAVYRITAFGTISVTGTPTFNFSGRIGGVAGTRFAQTGAITQSSGVTGKAWKAEIFVVCLTTGASGSTFGQLTALNGGTVAGVNPVTSPGSYIDGGTPATVDTTASQVLCLTATWGTASASNTITCRGFAAMRVA